MSEPEIGFNEKFTDYWYVLVNALQSCEREETKFFEMIRKDLKI